MTKNYLLLPLSAALILPLAGCIDDNYDLNDIDSTVRVDVNNLTIPINLDAVEMRNIMDIDDDDEIKVITADDGSKYYALEKKGDFDSKIINVEYINIPAPKVDAVKMMLMPTQSGKTLTCDLLSPAAPYSFVSTNITSSVVELESTKGNLDFDIKLTVAPWNNPSGSMTIENLKLQLPKGLNLGVGYDNQTGVYNAGTVTSQGSVFTIPIRSKEITFEKGEFNATNHSLRVSGEMKILGGKLSMDMSQAGFDSCPNSMQMTCEYIFSDYRADYFTGVFQYDVEDFNVNPLAIDNIPDVLSQEGTNVKLTNPAVYLHLNNPFGDEGIYAQAALTVVAVHKDNGRFAFSPNNKVMHLGKGNSDEANYMLSPLQHPLSLIAGYPDAQWVPFSTLGDILATPAGAGTPDGFPLTLEINWDNPSVPPVHVSDFRLGRREKIEGNYTFLAPLQFADGSVVYYTDSMDGWSSDELDKMTITSLDVNAIIDSDLPIDMDFTAYPIDKEGHRIPNVNVSSVKLPANAKDYQLTITVTGEFSGLDGLRFDAVAKGVDPDQPLRPSQTIHITKLRPRVSGYYQDEL